MENDFGIKKINAKRRQGRERKLTRLSWPKSNITFDRDNDEDELEIL